MELFFSNKHIPDAGEFNDNLEFKHLRMKGEGKKFHLRYRKKKKIFFSKFFCQECANFNVLTKKTIKA